MSRLRIYGNYYLGTGLISVVGTSFATLSTANAVRLFIGTNCYGSYEILPTDFQCHVCRWHMSFYYRFRWNRHTRLVSRGLRDGTRCVDVHSRKFHATECF